MWSPQRVSLTWTLWRGSSPVLHVRAAAAAAVWPERACTSSFDPLVGRPSPDSVHKQRTPPRRPRSHCCYGKVYHTHVYVIVCMYYTCVCSDLVQLNTPQELSSHRVEHTSAATSSSSEEEGGRTLLCGSGFSPLPRLSSRQQEGGVRECAVSDPSLPLHPPPAAVHS